jgi:quinol monooxygenase YgiN
MAKVIFLQNVELQAGKRQEFLDATEQLRRHFGKADGISYTVLESQDKADSFTEMFTFPDMASFEQFDDRDDDEEKELNAKIIGLAK